MARQFLIIDGYNLMHAAGIARPTYGPGDLQRCRERLVRWLLEHLDDSQRSDTQVVFDAAAAPSDSDLFQTVQGLHVVFAPAGTDADSEIERMLKKHSAPKQVIMVSSDHRLHKAAQRRKARPIDSEDFVAQMEEQPEPTSTHQSTNQSSSQPTTAEWAKIFGDIPEARELQQGQTGYPGEMPEIRDLDTT